jgi:hypothetical protein
MPLHPIQGYSCYQFLVCSRGYKWAREAKGPKSLVSVSNGVELLSNGLRALEKHALMGCLAFPIIDQGKGRGYMRENEKKKEKKQRRREP